MRSSLYIKAQSLIIWLDHRCFIYQARLSMKSEWCFNVTRAENMYLLRKLSQIEFVASTIIESGLDRLAYIMRGKNIGHSVDSVGALHRHNIVIVVVIVIIIIIITISSPEPPPSSSTTSRLRRRLHRRHHHHHHYHYHCFTAFKRWLCNGTGR